MPRGVDTSGHPKRRVERGSFTGMVSPWESDTTPTPAEQAEIDSIVDMQDQSEPDYEGIMERRHERRRPDWA